MSNKCVESDCTKFATFNKVGETVRLYCKNHKKLHMINIQKKKCLEQECNTIPCFNYQGNTTGLYCSVHMKEGMIDVKNRKCLELNCQKTPNYNYKDEKRGLYCVVHKKENMINILNNCIEPNCLIRATYNYKNESKALYCKSHIKPGMIDVKNRKCIEEGCQKISIYNINGETKGIYCSEHKKDNMINVKDKKCLESDCNKIPSYNNAGAKNALYCVNHKKDGMIDIKHLKCRSWWCHILANKKYDNYCLTCFVNLFPDKPTIIKYKTKERTVVDYILTHFPLENYSWVSDKKIQDGCSKKRPDLLLDLGYQVIIIEIDENQHIEYDCSCENKRLMLLSHDVGHRPIIFIRFNPDEYLTDTTKITSCWGLNNNGLYVIKKTKKKEWGERLDTLKLQIDYWINPENKTNKIIEIVQLFYNSL